MGKYRPTNSGPAGRRARRSSPRRLRSLSPAPFSFDDPPQSLTARRAAEPLAGAATGASEVHFAARDARSKIIRIRSLVLTLADWGRTCAGGVRRLGKRRLGFGCACRRSAQRHRYCRLWAWRFSRPSGVCRYCRLARLLPPSPSRSPTLGATVSSLGMGGSKRLLASFEQTRSLTRPTSPLTGTRLAASWYWAQGSCELPTAKPRMRSPYAPLRGASSIQLSPRGCPYPPA